ncbi:MAG: riboflavin synthase [Negativicutes bacterium]|nr:riboflavin synthase [Negativicutes bacterium]
MFTGLVEELGRVRTLAKGAKSARLTVAASVVTADLKLGDSIAVNGTCLTVVEFGKTWFTADIMPETVKRTVLRDLKPDDMVNLERTLKVGDRLGGHIVSGHIDGVGVIITRQTEDNAIIVKIKADPSIMRYIIPKGSIAIDGISLTVVECGVDWFSVSLIPHTAKLTTLGYKKIGEAVNLETDIIGKYVEKLVGGIIPATGRQYETSGITAEYLARHGFM